MSSAKIATGAYATLTKDCSFSPLRIERRALNSKDVHIGIKYCGICHSDLHYCSSAWGGASYPAIPGHEIVGVVEAVGADVVKYKKGDKVAVGCLVNSCLECANCKASDAQYCSKGAILTYGSVDRDGTVTHGGYSRDVIVQEDFVFRVPDNLDLAATAPLLCAGVTTYSPLVQHGLQKGGFKLGVIGLGGLGHMAVQFGKAFGNDVTVISTSLRKKESAEKEFGVSGFIVSTDPAHMKASEGTLDFILDTAAVEKDMEPYMKLLKTNGVMMTVGAPPSGSMISVNPTTLLMGRRSISGSIIGSLNEHQEMLDFCGKQGITARVEIVKCQDLKEAYERVEKGNVKYRFVLDIENSCPKADECPTI